MSCVAGAALVSLDDALALRAPPGALAARVFAHGSLEAEFYAPRGHDPQTPHTRDEIYVVARGEGMFFNGATRRSVRAGTFIFVPAGQTHRFEQFSSDFAVWVFFYGPQGGERAGASAGASSRVFGRLF